LSIAAEIRRLLPGLALDYLCDDAYFPYGDKPEPTLVERVAAIAGRLVARTDPRLLVVACNTASTVALPRLREVLAIPIVGVVPAVKPAARISRKRVIGVLGTEGTARRRYLQALIDEFAPDCTVLRLGSAALVELAERHALGEPPPAGALEAILAPFFDRPAAEQPDVIVLACTHFPLLRDALQRACPAGVALVDSGRAIAERVSSLLPDLPRWGGGPRRVFFTGPGANRAVYAQFGFEAAETLPPP
jgi:glutamate racemase